MKRISILLLLIPAFSFCQEKITIVKDTLLAFPTKSWPHSPVYFRCFQLSNGALIHVGSEIKLGKGTLPNGDYNWIATPSNSMEAKLKASTKLTSLHIEKMVKKGNDKYGVKYVIIGEGHYIIQLEIAISAGEIIAPKPNTITYNGETQKIVEATK